MCEDLIERIARQFAKGSRPSKTTKSVARALDEEWTLTERRRVLLYSRDLETHWNQLTDAEIENYWDIFPFLDDEGYLFYLPAYMSYILRRFPHPGSNSIDFTIYACTHSCEPFCLFTVEQMRCVIDFLIFCAMNDDFCDSRQAAKAVDLLERCPNAPRGVSK